MFQFVEDIVETNKMEDVKACFSFMGGYWAELRGSQAKLSHANSLRFQRACNMFTKRVSNNQDAEILGAVSTEVAKMMSFNDRAGLNMLFGVNKHGTPMDTEVGVSYSANACSLCKSPHCLYFLVKSVHLWHCNDMI